MIKPKNGLIISDQGDKVYYKNGLFHRLDGLPAYEYPDGSLFYYEEGQLHRVGDLPAEDYADGGKRYYENGKLHHLGRPAVDFINGYKEWWVNGKHLDCNPQEDFEQLMKLKASW